MATQPVRFNFKCASTTLSPTHNLPSKLIRAQPSAGGSGSSNSSADSDYINDFISAVGGILHEHEAACLSASSPTCEQCSGATVKVLQTPMSWLHVVEAPSVDVWVSPVCAREDCEMAARRRIQDVMRVIGEGEGGAGDERDGGLVCKVCGVQEGLKRCAGCRAVAYCGREHQRLDWKIHKRFCGLVG